MRLVGVGPCGSLRRTFEILALLFSNNPNIQAGNLSDFPSARLVFSLKVEGSRVTVHGLFALFGVTHTVAAYDPHYQGLCVVIVAVTVHLPTLMNDSLNSHSSMLQAAGMKSLNICLQIAQVLATVC